MAWARQLEPRNCPGKGKNCQPLLPLLCMLARADILRLGNLGAVNKVSLLVGIDSPVPTTRYHLNVGCLLQLKLATESLARLQPCAAPTESSDARSDCAKSHSFLPAL